MRMKYGVISLTSNRVRTWTKLAVSLHWRSTAEGRIRVTQTGAMSLVVEVNTTGLTTGSRSMSMLSKNDVMRGTLTIMVPSTTNLTDTAPLKEGATQVESKPFPII
jgi:hypothetical protein